MHNTQNISVYAVFILVKWTLQYLTSKCEEHDGNVRKSIVGTVCYETTI